MSVVDRSKSTFYASAQTSQGAVATTTGADAIQTTYDSDVLSVHVMTNPVERNIIRGSRLPNKRLVVGEWGEGSIGIELSPSVTDVQAPDYGILLKSLMGSETTTGSTITYTVAEDGDDTWYTYEGFTDEIRTIMTDGRCRSWTLNAEAGEIITQTFVLKSLTAADSDAEDAKTPTYDGTNPFVASSMTFTIAGAPKNCRTVEFTIDNPKMDKWINSAGIGDLPADSALTIEGTISIEAVDISPYTALFATTTVDIVIAATTGGQTCTITLPACQYSDNIDPQDDDGTVLWSIPFVCTGNPAVVFT
jgi:hypothetical protein